MRRGLFVLASLTLLVGCDESGLPDIDLERMIDQRRFNTYDACSFFEDGRAMRRPPEGTVPRDRVAFSPALTEGIVGGAYTTTSPVPVTRQLLEEGRIRFETWCAPCHGMRGDGDAQVAAKMSLRKPPSLIDARVRSFPAGRLFRVITLGYGLMRPYTEDLRTPRERWSTVAYLRALQLSQGEGALLGELSTDARRRALEELQ